MTQPDGTPIKRLDSSNIQTLGWRHKIELDEGIKLAYQDFVKMSGDAGERKRL